MKISDVSMNEMMRDLKKINIMIDRRINRKICYMNLTGVQGYVLIYILSHLENNLCSAMIHKELGVSRATISELIKKLRKKEYLYFEDCPEDGRQKTIHVTEKTKKLAKELHKEIEEINYLVYKNFTKEEFNLLDKIQKKILGNLCEDNTDDNKEVF